MRKDPAPPNLDPEVVRGFGEEWAAFAQDHLDPAEHKRLFDRYFSLFPFEALNASAAGFDLGCGSGRWAMLVAGRVGILHCIDPAAKALAVARANLRNFGNVQFHECGVDELPFADESMDFGYSLGVLHHVPDPEAALRQCVRKLKPGAPFLLYLYYAFDNRPAWYRWTWKASDVGRKLISRLPFRARKAATTAIAALVYWPLSRAAGVSAKLGVRVKNFPLSDYRGLSFYTMRTDALDRFGTRLEHRFSKDQIRSLMERSGLEDVQFREGPHYWVACGIKTA
jgi:SAM-dependent methyltransferase